MPTLAWLEIAGFRSFSVAQRLDFTEPLALIWGGNSQGKTSIAEAIEFLLTGDTVRRTLLGGDQAEYYASLRCVHHPDGEAVTVSAGIVDTTGQERLVERTLDADYGRGQECATTLTVDGVARTDLADLGIVLAEPPLRAPVLFQHSVRYALSARPSDRLAYFKALLELADLDALASGIGMAVNKIAAVPTAIEGDLATCLADADLADALAPLRDDATSATTIASVTAAVGAAFRALGEEEAARTRSSMVLSVLKRRSTAVTSAGSTSQRGGRGPIVRFCPQQTSPRWTPTASWRRRSTLRRVGSPRCSRRYSPSPRTRRLPSPRTVPSAAPRTL